ncbi:delta-60 repeat domain-containing protein [Chiayiivirga flava]|uniref:Putative delta-60 repeat protein n=1 Tax=Chiayiivirga flava TaxID=659595 RepID=A0A7W8D8I7_9GAMM|nr:delta-60 repeat domain-containing protein [Chiayiivirga flava]MBB5208561.1 putative delta-60 repeat protein [Chiayiivirga flava]
MHPNPLRWLLAAALCLPFIAVAAVPGDEAEGSPAFVDIAGADVEGAVAVAVQPDGKILLAGGARVGDSVQIAFARTLPDGTPDAGFADGGQRRVGFGGDTDSIASWIGVLPDGRIVIVGSVVDPDTATVSIVVIRLLANGEFDTTFSIDGRARFGEDIGAFCGFPFAFDSVTTSCGVALLPDGSVVLAGGATQPEPAGAAKGLVGFGAGVLLYKIRPDATPDPGFGVAGRRFYGHVPGHPDTVFYGLLTSLVRRDDGRLLLATGGIAAGSEQPTIALAQFRADAAPDTAFGDGGATLVPTEIGDAFIASGLRLTRTGRIMVGAVAILSGVRAFVAARFLADGTPDASFGSGGVAGVSFDLSGNPDSDDTAAALHVDSAGRAYVIGHAEMPPFEGQVNYDVAIARFTPAGQPDTAFAPGGKATYGYDISAGGSPFVVLRERAADVAVDGQGRIVVVGSSEGPGDLDGMQLRTIYTDDLFRNTFE